MEADEVVDASGDEVAPLPDVSGLFCVRGTRLARMETVPAILFCDDLGAPGVRVAAALRAALRDETAEPAVGLVALFDMLFAERVAATKAPTRAERRAEREAQERRLLQALRDGAKDTPAGYTIRELSLATGLNRHFVDAYIFTGDGRLVVAVNPERSHEFRRWVLAVDAGDEVVVDAGVDAVASPQHVERELLRRMHAGEMYPSRPIDDARRALLRLLLLRPSASTPERRCNGGPWALDLCGRTATIVGNDDGLEYFACDDHAGPARVPIAAWFKKLERPA